MRNAWVDGDDMMMMMMMMWQIEGLNFLVWVCVSEREREKVTCVIFHLIGALATCPKQASLKVGIPTFNKLSLKVGNSQA